MTPFAFHAAPPAGEWINDPNGLCFADGCYRLYAQHAADAPAFGAVGWGAFSSDDLLHWRWDGDAILPDRTGSAYSGSLIDARTAFLTRHDRSGPRQSQHLRDIKRGNETAALGPAGRNCRDPFVFRWGDGWSMLVALPCDWTEWQREVPSRIEVWRSPDLQSWESTGTIGPWQETGILWEVPVLLDFGEMQALVVSLVDRRLGRASGSVRYWLGRFDGGTFARARDFPADGIALDLGPDFYAVCPNLEAGWPQQDRVIVAWASNWDSARSLELPGGGHGGPICLPRRVVRDRGRLRQSPLANTERFQHWTSNEAAPDFNLRIARGSARINLTVADNRARISREAGGALDWSAEHVLDEVEARELTLFVDGPLLELFIAPEGRTLTAILPGDSEIDLQYRAF